MFAKISLHSVKCAAVVDRDARGKVLRRVLVWFISDYGNTTHPFVVGLP
jgi:hypothetical protein